MTKYALIVGALLVIVGAWFLVPSQGTRLAVEPGSSTQAEDPHALKQVVAVEGKIVSSGVVSTSGQQVQKPTAKNNVPTEPLAIGDKKYSSTPKKGYIYTCQSSFTGRGAFSLGDWADTARGLWWPSKKPTVDGNVKWNAASVHIGVAGDKRVIASNALPVNATTGIFPISSTDDAYQYDRNPNSIKEQSISYSLDLNPTVQTKATCVGGEVGIALNGVPIFDGFDAEGRDAAVHEIQDSCNGHPQISGEYHYHNLSPCLNVGEDATGRPALIGYAFDGFGIYGPYENGKKLTTADLDECHGKTSEVLWNGKAQSIYHYVATDDFPYTVGCFRGTPVRAAVTGAPEGQGDAPQGMQGGQPPTPPQEAIDACSGKAVNASCSVGPGTGVCRTVGTTFACIPN